ncbi:MAG: PhzF family phenazine biosynthesis isomerase, partial [Pseudomonadota bacterium]
ETARAVGYSETAFAWPVQEGFRVRYFAPAMEVAFCGHATIALTAALGAAFGEGSFQLQLNDAAISTRASKGADGNWQAMLHSPPTKSQAADSHCLERVMHEAGILDYQLDQTIPPAFIHAGADHLLIALKSRLRLSQLGYHFARVQAIMQHYGLVTICVTVRESERFFHARNLFAAGGVYEDPATGAAAAAFAGYLRDLAIIEQGQIDIIQGEDMGQTSHLIADLDPIPASPVRISGSVAWL